MSQIMNFDPAFYAQPMGGGAGAPQSPSGDMMTFGAPSGGMMMGPDGVARAGALPPGGQNQIGQAMMQNQMANQATGAKGEEAGGNWYDGLVPTSGTDNAGNWKGFGDFFGGIGEWLGNNAGTITGIGSIAGALTNANDTRQLGVGIQTYLDSLGQQLNTDSQFQGYGVTSGLGNGSSAYGEDGKLSTDLGMIDQYADYNWGEAGAPAGYVAGMNGLAQQAANSAYSTANTLNQQAGMSIADRQTSIYDDIMATQNPELNRMQTEQQAAEYARGRGGVRGSQYGGTAEDAAMARARTMASNDAAFRAREMANSERGMLGQLAGQMGAYGNQAAQAAYLPMQQQMALMGLGQSNADMAQTGQLTGLDYMSQLALGGTNANMQAQHSANQLTGNLYDTLLSNIGGAQGSDGGSASGLLGGIGNGLDWLTKFLGGITDGEQT